MKITRTNQVAIASSLVTHLLDKPCRFVLSIQASLRVMGRRLPCTRDFEVRRNVYISIFLLTHCLLCTSGVSGGLLDNFILVLLLAH